MVVLLYFNPAINAYDPEMVVANEVKLQILDTKTIYSNKSWNYYFIKTEQGYLRVINNDDFDRTLKNLFKKEIGKTCIIKVHKGWFYWQAIGFEGCQQNKNEV